MWYGDPLPDYYAILGVDRRATDREIVVAYRRQVRLCHPDAHPEGGIGEERIREVNQAYEVLGDPARRAEYDRALAHQEMRESYVPPERTHVRYGAPRPEWCGRPTYASPWRRQPSVLADLLAVLDALFDVDDLELERAFAHEVERLLFAELRRPRRPFRPL